jgi:hypothetical protein
MSLMRCEYCCDDGAWYRDRFGNIVLCATCADCAGAVPLTTEEIAAMNARIAAVRQSRKAKQ